MIDRVSASWAGEAWGEKGQSEGRGRAMRSGEVLVSLQYGTLSLQALHTRRRGMGQEGMERL